ncbi:MAG: alanine racemase [Acidimicrobiales bacterium]
MRPTSCEIDLGAIAHNVGVLTKVASPAALCAVVKADGYGHGAAPVARTALDAGASSLAVALVEEGIELRGASIDAEILLLSEPPVDGMTDVVRHHLVPSLYTPAGVEALAGAAAGSGRVVEVEVCVDTGMRRVGASPTELPRLVDLIAADPALRLRGVWSHCPVADEPGNPFTEEQIMSLDALVSTLEIEHRHLGNTAFTIDHATGGHDLVRVGIGIYGIDPSPALAGRYDLRPALSLHSAVSFIKPLQAGDGVGYGHRWHASEPTTIATVPVGYADGVRRDLGLRGGEVLIRGRRHPIVGVVTMDQLMVDVGDHSVMVGDDVVLIGEQGQEKITANEIAELLDTIGYEIVCAIGKRVPRHHRSA